MTRHGRLFTKNTGLCKVVRPCIGADACPLSEGQGNCDLMIGEPVTEAPGNGGRNYNGSKIVKFIVRWKAKKASFQGPEPLVRYHSRRARILTFCQDLWAKGQSQVDTFYGV
ncbi:hypothetical protein Goarm_010944 [Gossypium armourianum]|uniref:Uncharacterized protein n=1 Tax=Gossypium armourianum TaxID=34283 RepID=A0A7J9IV97_9ROSI|nr:hypothetical protein [Gossypium armourianum]